MSSLRDRLRRHRLLAVWALLSLLLAAGGWALGYTMRTDDRAAESAAASSSRGLVQVSRQALSTEYTQSGTFRTGTRTDVPAPNVDGRRVVTQAALKPGDRVSSGQLLAVVSGQPLFAAEIPFSFYRPLAEGDRGEDVAALNRLLASLGYSSGGGSEFTGRTAEGLRGFYRDRGQTVPVPSTAEDQSRPAASPSAGAAGTDEDASPAAGGRSDVRVEPEHFFRLPDGQASIASINGVGAELGADDAVAVIRTGAPFATVRVGLDAIDTVRAYEQDRRPVQLTIRAQDSDEATELTGTVARISAFREAAPDSQQPPGYDVDITVDDAGEELTDESRVTARFTAEESTESLVVPLIAVRSDGDGTYLLVVAPTGDAAEPSGGEETRCNVELGRDSGGLVAITPERDCAQAGTDVAIDS